MIISAGHRQKSWVCASAHSHYPPDGVANYAIMLMLMCTRKMNQTMLRAAAQDYTLPGKMGKDLSNCTVGVIGTGKIGRTVIRHLSGFGCKDFGLRPVPERRGQAVADYVTLDEFYAQSDVITCTRTPPRKTTTSSTPSRWPR